MKIRLRMVLLLALAAAAIYTGSRAAATLRPDWERAIPEEIYADYLAKSGKAEYVLRGSDGRVAIFRRRRDTEPESTTDIELSSLREADRAMLMNGIPVENRRELLELLEDLGV